MTIYDYINNPNLVIDENTILEPIRPMKYRDYFLEHPELVSIEEDICLVHTTDFFPFNKRISSPSEQKIVINDAEYSSKKGTSVPCKRYYNRRTIHFALNGLVSDHMYGSFQNKKFTILEPIKHHVDEIKALRPEDTWTTSGVNLSNEALILINKQRYDELSLEEKNELQSKNYNIIFCENVSASIVRKILNSLGYLDRGIGARGWSEFDANGFIGDFELFQEKAKTVFCHYNDTSNFFNTHDDSFYKRLDENISRREKAYSAWIGGNLIDYSKPVVFALSELVDFLDFIKNDIKSAVNYITMYIKYNQNDDTFEFMHPDECYSLKMTEKKPNKTASELHLIEEYNKNVELGVQRIEEYKKELEEKERLENQRLEEERKALEEFRKRQTEMTEIYLKHFNDYYNSKRDEQDKSDFFIGSFFEKFDLVFDFDVSTYFDDARNVRKFLVLYLTGCPKYIQDDIFKSFGGVIIYPHHGTEYIGFEWLPNETMDDFLIRMTPILEGVSKKLSESNDNDLSM